MRTDRVRAPTQPTPNAAELPAVPDGIVNQSARAEPAKLNGRLLGQGCWSRGDEISGAARPARCRCLPRQTWHVIDFPGRGLSPCAGCRPCGRFALDDASVQIRCPIGGSDVSIAALLCSRALTWFDRSSGETHASGASRSSGRASVKLVANSRRVSSRSYCRREDLR